MPFAAFPPIQFGEQFMMMSNRLGRAWAAMSPPFSRYVKIRKESSAGASSPACGDPRAPPAPGFCSAGAGDLRTQAVRGQLQRLRSTPSMRALALQGS